MRDGYTPMAVSAFRFVFGLLFTMHGAQKVFAWPVGIGNGGPIPAGTWPFWYAGVIELVLGTLLLIGLWTRLAAFIASGEMAVGYFTEHQPSAFWPIENGGEEAVMNCFAFLVLVFIGGGAVAVDAVRQRRT